ncbi:MAG: efflux RND transporter periplasmic adaptor subunit [Candidatus Nomurabacteria bacterium]
MNINQIQTSSFFEKVKTVFLENPKKLIFLILVIIFAFFFFNNNSTAISIGHLEKGNLQEVVSVSGTITPSQESSMAFEKAGRIEKINVKVGDKVVVGQVLSSLSGGVDYAGVLSAQAQLEVAQANLQDAQNGPSQTDVAVKQTNVDSATTNLNTDYNSVSDTVRSINTTVTDILGNQISNIFTYSSSFYKLNFNSCDQSSQSKIENGRFALDSKVTSLSGLVNSSLLIDNSLSQTEKDAKIDNIANQVYSTVIAVSTNLDDLNRLLTLPCSISDSSLEKYRNSVSVARNSITGLLSNINSLKSKIDTDRNTLSSAKSSLDQLKAGSTDERIKSLKAQVEQANANLISAKASNSKNSIVAPFDGVVTAININLGEISSPNSPAINLISSNNLELKVKLAETDLVKVKVGDKANINLDTYGDSVAFPGVVGQVDPAATVEGNASTYYAKIEFSTADDRIRSGMNGSADIITQEKDNVDYISPNYLKVEGIINKVKVIKDIKLLDDTSSGDTDSNIEWKNIEIGIRDNSGKVEVLSGLTDKDNLYPIGIEVLTATSTK